MIASANKPITSYLVKYPVAFWYDLVNVHFTMLDRSCFTFQFKKCLFSLKKLYVFFKTMTVPRKKGHSLLLTDV